MKRLSLGLSAEDVLYDLILVRNSITDDESFQKADSGLVLSHLDDIISMCRFAVENGYGAIYNFKSGVWEDF